MCIKPLNLSDRTVKCGQCKECLTQRARTWALRLTEESRCSKSAYFLTLTYREEDIPVIDTVYYNREIQVTTLVKKDVQDFLKRLRHHQSKLKGEPLRIFYTGEYGGKFGRAHYHIVVFNMLPELTSFNPQIRSNKAQKDYKLRAIWKKGFVDTGRVQDASIRYVTNYMMTKNIDTIGEQEAPFLECSKGLGANYLKLYEQRHWDQGEYRMVTNKPEKYRPMLPRYYMDKLFDEDTKRVINDFKAEDAEDYHNEILEKAEKREPLDPYGYIREARKHKQEVKEREQKFKQNLRR